MEISFEGVKRRASQLALAVGILYAGTGCGYDKIIQEKVKYSDEVSTVLDMTNEQKNLKVQDVNSDSKYNDIQVINSKNYNTGMADVNNGEFKNNQKVKVATVEDFIDFNSDGLKNGIDLSLGRREVILKALVNDKDLENKVLDSEDVIGDFANNGIKTQKIERCAIKLTRFWR